MDHTQVASATVIAVKHLLPQDNIPAFLLLLACGVVLVYLLYPIFQKISQNQLKYWIMISLIGISLYCSVFVNILPLMKWILGITGATLISSFIFLGILGLYNTICVLQWPLAIIIPAFIIGPFLHEEIRLKDAAVCALFTLLIVNLLDFILTPYPWFSVFSDSATTLWISLLGIQLVLLAWTFMFAGIGYWILHELKKRFPMIRRWLAGEQE
jgi:hypothetical protein